ncbi:3-hydroxyacyl-CoA dehydrogenase NAD-binding domain-containing protein [Candidatus Palauibacter sp.]|uniref:3-hydroxyacyl-CoA dehydrogenase NAD-binding domain-containing protein n=1 Tax=Candidatus Palauibacter sp. TaxID=3101350 RepID=UPI003B595759
MVQTPAPLRLEIDADKIAWLVFDTPGAQVNLLDIRTMRHLDRCLSELESRIATGHPVAVILWSGKPGTFIAGADVNEIAKVEDAEDGRAKSAEGQRIFRRLERLPVPKIAAIDGVCLGGGAELALACDWRIASNSPGSAIGLPEVRLGLIPGFGGSVRLPRLIGIQRALSMVLTGRSVSAATAYRYGLIDQILDADRFRSSVALVALDAVLGRVERLHSRLSARDRLLEGTRVGRHVLFGKARKRVLEMSGRIYPAPLAAIDVIEESINLSIDEALAVEAEALGRLLTTPVCRNLVRLFRLGQAAKKALPPDVLAQARGIDRVAVLGAGVMGGGIAELVAANDIPVILKDIDEEALDVGLRHASELLQKAGKRGIIPPAEVGLKFALVHGTLTYERFDEVDVVIEAVIERLPVKRNVLREAEEMLPAHAIFATNTSSLSVTELGKAAARPERVVGLHFFNPVHRMPLVEIIRTESSSDATLATAFKLAGQLGKTPVLVADRPGFIVNRLLAPYLNEVGFLLENGADVAGIDRALTSFGMPMGPCRLLDEVGFDVAEHVAKEMARAFGDRMRPSAALDTLTNLGRLGRKNSRGFYTYSDREQRVDREVGRAFRGAGGGVHPEEIVDRCLLLAVNEALYALAEGVVAGAGDVDLAMVLGTGFPPFRGGLMAWAETRGARAVRDRLLELRQRHGDRFAPAPGLERLAASDGSFTSGRP